MTQTRELLDQHPGFKGRIGIAREDITPPLGIYSRNWGAAKHDTADSIHRPLTLTALTIASSSGDAPLVLVDADLGWWRPLDLFSRFQERLLEELSLESSHLIFALSHTHAAAPLMEADSSLPGSDLLEQWMERVYQAAVSAIGRALADADEAILDWHKGRCALAAVRDFPDPDPTADRMVCGFNPEADADDTLLVGRITDSSGTVRATLVNYACHPTTLAWENTSISPDYIGAMRETMEEATGATAFFLQGMSGDVAPRHQYVGDVEVADRHGRQLGFAALATLNDMEPTGNQLCFDQVVESGAPLAVWQHQPHKISSELRAIEVAADLELKDWPTADELEQQRLACNDRAVEERLRRKRDIRRSLGDGSSFPLAVHAWRIGDAVLVGCAGEAYSQLQKELRSRYPHLAVICMNLINGSVGYLPPADLYDVDVYPVWQTPFDRGCLERISDVMTGVIEELQD
ncbi:MAG: alkaline ceramidase [Woeseiales bacterium]